MSDSRDYYRELENGDNCGITYNRFMDAKLQYRPAIRTYPYSPDQVCVQLRASKHYISAQLRTDVAREFAEAILRAVEDREKQHD